MSKLAGAGFENVGIEPTCVYSIEDARGFLAGRGLNVDTLVREVEGKFISAFVRASKPVTGCCSPRLLLLKMAVTDTKVGGARP